MVFRLIILTLFCLGQSIYADLPTNYEALNGCEKQSVLWRKITRGQHKELPKYKGFGAIELIGMSWQRIELKYQHYSDVAPAGWKKFLHRRGAMAKVRYVSKGDHPYSGIFKGAECALVRLSLTYNPESERGVAPGLALKVLRDKVHSANVSMLYALDGQGDNFNFFQHPLSNIVPAVDSFGHNMVHSIFKKVTDYPEELVLTDMAQLDAYGEGGSNVRSPRQLFLVPGDGLKFSEKEHEIRKDFLSIPSGTVLYKVYAVSDEHKNFDYQKYTKREVTAFLQGSSLIGELVTTSQFVASEFADTGIFFRHQIRPKSKK